MSRKDKGFKKNKLYTVLIIVFAIIFFISLIMLIFILKDYFTAKRQNDDLKDLLDEKATEDEINNLPEGANIDFARLYGINNDFIGWIKIEGSVIDYPVVLSHDNNDYLKTDFYGNYHRLGCVFADYRSTITKDYQSENIILYGHSAADGSYFNSIRSYKSIDFYKAHKTVSFNTLYENADYVIVGAFISLPYSTEEDGFEYFNHIDMTEDEFGEYIKEVNARSYFNTDIDVAFGDKLLTLSTCDYEYDDTRFVVVARKLRENETLSDFENIKVIYNPNRYVPDEQ